MALAICLCSLRPFVYLPCLLVVLSYLWHTLRLPVSRSLCDEMFSGSLSLSMRWCCVLPQGGLEGIHCPCENRGAPKRCTPLRVSLCATPLHLVPTPKNGRRRASSSSSTSGPPRRTSVTTCSSGEMRWVPLIVVVQLPTLFTARCFISAPGRVHDACEGRRGWTLQAAVCGASDARHAQQGRSSSASFSQGHLAPGVLQLAD